MIADMCGLYVHVPFCRRKCRYCDFVSRQPREDEMDRFTGAVQREITMRVSPGMPAGTVYFGGGTPSLLGAERLRAILRSVRDRLVLAPEAEITVEANPLDVTQAWSEACLVAGFNRASLGVQSMDDGDLEFLGRVHRAADGPCAVAAARAAGFREIGIDLIYGLPNHSPETVEKQIRTAVEACSPDHVSCYQLTYAPDTPLGRDLAAGRIAPLSEDAAAALFLRVHAVMASLGLPAYEVSNFALHAHRSRHNMGYWEHRPYIGLGPAAHSFELPVRSWNVSSLDEYLVALEGGHSAVAGTETLSGEQLAMETVLLALRTTDGLDRKRFLERFGRDVAASGRKVLDGAVKRGLLVVTERCIRPTREGLAVADRLAEELASSGAL